MQAFECETSIPLELKKLSLETMSVIESTDTFRTLLPKLVQEFKLVSQAIKVPFAHLIQSKEKKVVAHLSELNYINLSSCLVPVPENFSGQFLDYLRTLKTMQSAVYGTANEFIKEYSIILSSFITNKDDRISSQDMSFLFNSIEQKSLEYSKTLSSFFQAPTKLGRAKLGSVIARIADIESIINTADSIASTHNQSELKDIELSITKIISMLDIIIEQMKQQDITKVSRAAAQNLSQGAYNLARYIEFISVFHFRTTAMLKMVEDLVDFLNKQI